MRIVCISDTHGLHDRLKLPEGDLLIHAGDFTHYGQPYEVQRFLEWFASQPHPAKVFVAGNHDFYAERHKDRFLEKVRPLSGVLYLEDSGGEVAGLRVWGSPVQPWYFDWAFNRQRGPEIQAHWELIPADTQLLITHGPPVGVLDENFAGVATGCQNLRESMAKLPELRLHVFGHMHSCGGQHVEVGHCRCVNAAICDDRGYATRKPVVVEW